MRYRLVCLSLLSVFAAGGCTVGSGSGSASGPIWVIGCLEGGNYGTPEAPREFDLKPTFFAGEPIEDITDGPHINRLIIRMQRNGNGIESNDTLYIDIPDSGLVAHCIRGRTVGGVPDYDATTSGSIDVDQPPWCDWSAGGMYPRINVLPDGPVRIALAPLRTCGSQARPPAFVNVVGDAAVGWIEFEDFGLAQQPTLPPEERDPFGTDFKVGFGQRLRATFHIEQLLDHRVVIAIREDDVLPQPSRIGGMLDGYFDFNMERGRAAQPFP